MNPNATTILEPKPTPDWNAIRQLLVHTQATATHKIETSSSETLVLTDAMQALQRACLILGADIVQWQSAKPGSMDASLLSMVELMGICLEIRQILKGSAMDNAIAYHCGRLLDSLPEVPETVEW